MRLNLTLLALTVAVVISSSCGAPDGRTERRLFGRDSAVADEKARFDRPRRPARGDDNSALTFTLTPSEQVAIYKALLPEPNLGAVDEVTAGRSIDRRPWLDAKLLPHEGRYEQYLPLPSAVLRGLVETGRFRGPCGGDSLPACSNDEATTYLFSAIYRIGLESVRVFVVSGSPGFGTEKMYRLERRGDDWIVVDEATIMITEEAV